MMFPNAKTARLGLGIILAIGLLGMVIYLAGQLGTGRASDGSKEPTASPVLTGDNVVETDGSGEPPLINPTRRIIQGEKVEGGCAFSGYLEPGPGEQYIVIRSLATNWDTCEQLVEQGNVSSADGKKLFDDSEASEDTPAPDNGRTDPISNYFAASQETHIIKLQVGWKDPPALTVNFAHTGMEFTISGNQVTYQDGNCRWFKFAGWSRDYHLCEWRYRNNQSIVEVDQFEDFSNDSFPCEDGFEGAETTYRDRVGATSSGPFVSYHSEATGDCAWLLHRYVRVYSNWDD